MQAGAVPPGQGEFASCTPGDNWTVSAMDKYTGWLLLPKLSHTQRFMRKDRRYPTELSDALARRRFSTFVMHVRAVALGATLQDSTIGWYAPQV